MEKIDMKLGDVFLHELDKKYGYEVWEENNPISQDYGKLFFRGAGTDWCFFPLEMMKRRRNGSQRKIKI